MRIRRSKLGLAIGLVISPGLTQPLFAQGDSVEERLRKLEAENAKLKDQMEAVSGQLEMVEFRDIIPPVGESVSGMGPAASKIYSKDEGLSIGGYGEMVYRDPAGPSTSKADYLRNVIYLGYKFEDRWVFNSEIEVEHANEVYLEFAYLEYINSEACRLRAGMLLIPMGIVNEMHEPTTFLGPLRPLTERRIIPSTWRENGLGVLGGQDRFSYKCYLVNGLDASGFSKEGLRGGRQKGSEAMAEDIAAVARVDWNCVPGLDFGLSGYYGDSGQGQTGLGDATTTIFDAHLQYQWRALRLRGLYAMAHVDDTPEISAMNGINDDVAEEMNGWYLEAGYDVAKAMNPDCGQSVTPYLRYEEIDTQAKMAPGLSADPAQDDRLITMGVDWKPISNIVFKVAYEDFEKSADSLQLSMGYVF